MTAPDAQLNGSSPAPPAPTVPAPQPVAPAPGPASRDPRTRLRGAGVDVDARRVVQALVWLCLVTLAVVAVVLIVAGARKNAQITELKANGIPTRITVTGCLGLLGGSGSNAAGYVCTGTYTVDHQRHTATLPGNSLLAPGTSLAGVVDPSDPTVFTTERTLEGERASGKVFVVPAALLLVLAASLGALGWRARRRRRRAVSPPSPPAPA